MAFDPWAQTNQGLSNLTNTLGTLAQLKRQDQQYADEQADRQQRRTLADLQLRAAQRQEADTLSLRDALTNAKGGYLYPEPQGMGPVQPGQESTLSSLMPEQQEATSQDRLNIMGDLASKGNTAAMEQYGNASSLTQKLAEHRAKVAAYGDLESAAKIDETLDKMDKSGKALEHWMKVDPTGEMARQGIAANPSLFNGMDPAKMQVGKTKDDPPAFFPAPDGGHTFFDGKEWKHVTKPKEPTEKLQLTEIPSADGKTAQKAIVNLETGEQRTIGKPYAVKSQVPNINVQTGGAARGKPPAGYRYTAEGDLEPIPGGPAAQKVVTAAKAQEGAVQSITTAIEAARGLLSHPGRKSSTGFSSITNAAAIPGGAAKTFLNDLDTFKSQMFIPMVQQLKGMGQLSDAEGKKLLAAVGNLETTSSEGAFVANLNKVIRDLEGTLQRASQPISEGPTGKQPARNAAKQLDATTAQRYLRQAGGNKDKARELAKKAGYSF